MRKREYYYREAQKAGYRSRASYKLKQINDKFEIFKVGNLVLDIGAAPGGWSQIASDLVKPSGKVYAIDIEHMEPLDNVYTIRGDITAKDTHERLRTIIGVPLDVVICDISPKVSGNWSTDHARQIYLSEEALRLAVSGLLKQGGKFVCKLFQGDLFEAFMDNVKKLFTVVYLFKPKASRKQSAEIYVIAKGLKKGPIKWKKKPEKEGKTSD
jgi:23S rRNA (uridine2552-2'-O)-methyltransferase